MGRQADFETGACIPTVDTDVFFLFFFPEPLFDVTPGNQSEIVVSFKRPTAAVGNGTGKATLTVAVVDGAKAQQLRQYVGILSHVYFSSAVHLSHPTPTHPHASCAHSTYCRPHACWVLIDACNPAVL